MFNDHSGRRKQSDSSSIPSGCVKHVSSGTNRSAQSIQYLKFQQHLDGLGLYGRQCGGPLGVAPDLRSCHQPCSLGGQESISQYNDLKRG